MIICLVFIQTTFVELHFYEKHHVVVNLVHKSL